MAGFNQDTQTGLETGKQADVKDIPVVQQAYQKVNQQMMHQAQEVVLQAAQQQNLSPPVVENLNKPEVARDLMNFAASDNREGFDAILGNVVEQNQKDALWMALEEEVKKRQNEELAKAYPGVHGTEDASAVLAAGKENATVLERYGNRDAEVSFLSGCGENLNDQQRRDMLKAAADVGFSAASISHVGGQWGLMRERERMRELDPDAVEGGLDAAEYTLYEYMRFHMQRLLSDQITAERSILAARTEAERVEATKKANSVEQKLANFIGAPHAREARELIQKQGGDQEKFIEQALLAQLELSKKLHTHHLGEVGVTKVE